MLGFMFVSWVVLTATTARAALTLLPQDELLTFGFDVDRDGRADVRAQQLAVADTLLTLEFAFPEKPGRLRGDLFGGSLVEDFRTVSSLAASDFYSGAFSLEDATRPTSSSNVTGSPPTNSPKSW